MSTTIDNLLARCEHSYDPAGQDAPWRNKVARQLNAILGRVEYSLGTTGDESDVEFAEAALAIVERVEGFESIKRTLKPRERDEPDYDAPRPLTPLENWQRNDEHNQP